MVACIMGECYHVDDVVQDTFVQALWVKIKDQPANTKLATYVFFCMRNAAVTKSKMLEERHTDFVDPTDTESTVALGYQTAPSSANPTREVETKDAVQFALKRLSERDQELILMHYVDGYKYTEISEKLGVKVTTLKRRASEAVKKMREVMESEFGITAAELA